MAYHRETTAGLAVAYPETGNKGDGRIGSGSGKGAVPLPQKIFENWMQK